MEAKKAKEVLEKRYRKHNDYIKNSFDRVSVTLPKGTKDIIKKSGYTVNGLINDLVSEWIQKTNAESVFDDFPKLED